MTALMRGTSAQGLLSAAFRLRELGIGIALVVTVLLFSLRATNFATVSNWQDIASDVAMVVVVAVGETMVVLTRNIDLSVGSIAGLSAYLSADTLATHNGLPIVVMALIAVGVGLAAGLVNGLLVAVGRIPAIIATLATLSIYRGLVFEATGGNYVFPNELPQSFQDLAAEKPLGLPFLAWVALGVALAGGAILRWAPWARDFYAIGSNPDAARLVAVPVTRRVITAFAASGALAGLGGFMFAVRFANVDTNSARGFELDVVTAVVIGGVNVFGGSGTILGVTLGALLVAVIDNGFTLLKFSEFWKIFFEGTAIVVAVTLDALVKRRVQDALRGRRRAGLMVREQGAVP
ncbi:MAG TPA: ABC transporter permease [Gaiellaceae bacterium]|nr:ABC transporter permease [Gaiellaceae bacterium]